MNLPETFFFSAMVLGSSANHQFCVCVIHLASPAKLHNALTSLAIPVRRHWRTRIHTNLTGKAIHV